MKYKISLLVTVFLALQTNINAQNKGNADTLKKDIQVLGNLFKKAGEITITIPGISKTDYNYTGLVNNLRQTLNVKSVEDEVVNDTAIIQVMYKGKTKTLWSQQSAQLRQLFTVASATDSTAMLKYKYEKIVVKTTVIKDTVSKQPVVTSAVSQEPVNINKPASNIKPYPAVVELYDLINVLIPDSASTFDYVSWDKIKTIESGIKWSAKEYNKIEKKYIENGEAHISINKKIFECGGQENCTWGVSLDGLESGYSSIWISPDLSFTGEWKTSVDYLLNKKDYKYKLLKQCDNANQEKYYEIKMPGKKSFILYTYIDGGSGGDALYLQIYFNPKDIEIECVYQ